MICNNQLCYCDGSCKEPSHTGDRPRVPDSETAKRIDEINDKSLDPVYEPFKPIGWICPNCGRGVSPFVTSCPCTNIPFKITCGS